MSLGARQSKVASVVVKPKARISRPRIAKVTRPRLIEVPLRERLFVRLDTMRSKHPLPWVFGPAGSGKTSLLTSYVVERKIPALWYQVDEGDRDAADLFHYLRLAVAGLANGQNLRVGLPVYSPAIDLMAFTRRFFEALFEGLPQGAILIFDDYHSAPHDSSWQSAFAKALACLPEGLNIIVSSRRAPPSTLARALVHAEIALLGADDLRLTAEEAMRLAELQGGRRSVSRATVERIHERTGGWAAGVSLLLRRNDPSDASLLSYQTHTQPVFDYLAGAIFSELGPKAQRVLLCTACLPSFTAAQAVELSGVAEAQKELQALCRAGMFIVFDGGSQEVFHLHESLSLALASVG